MPSLFYTGLKLNKESEEENNLKPTINMKTTKLQYDITPTFVTPELAANLLKKNTANRRLKSHHIEKMCIEIKSGRWKYPTGELLKFSVSDVMIDGQNRLSAIIKSGTGIWIDIATGLPDDIFSVLDTGSSRNASDTLEILGIKNSNLIPSIMAKYFLLKQKQSNGKASDYTLSNERVKQLYFENELFWQDVAKKSLVWYSQFAKIIRPSVFGGFYAFFSEISPSQAYDFMSQLSSGKIDDCQSIILLRNKLITDKTSIRNLPVENKDAFITKTWNAYRTGNDFKILKFDPEKENYPKAI